MDIIHPLAEAYSYAITSDEDELLQLIYEQTSAKHPKAHMLSGKVQGQFLTFVSQMLQPKYVLEIGTFTGYSAVCLAKGLQYGGELHTIELRDADAQTAQSYFNQSKQKKEIHLHIGEALSIIPQLTHNWDLVFIDADKTGYIDYYELVVPLLSKKGVIIADNVFFHGQVLEQPLKGKNAIAIDAFNKHVAADPRTENVLLSVRDGLLLIKKK
ncbi:O-methyltransferase [Parasediminibacterium sp. JCM 36343]|uniref:O-methyltransferase n=1 Tax=Parasediminibacterium sp. JCM 36343 TaxID=3374279 RepID=UPI00397D88F7